MVARPMRFTQHTTRQLPLGSVRLHWEYVEAGLPLKSVMRYEYVAKDRNTLASSPVELRLREEHTPWACKQSAPGLCGVKLQ